MILLGPDCRDGKHRACDGRGFDLVADVVVSCECACHLSRAELEARVTDLTAARERLRAKVWMLLNDPDNHEYEGLGLNAVEDLRTLFDIPEPTGPWLAREMDPPPSWVLELAADPPEGAYDATGVDGRRYPVEAGKLPPEVDA